MLKDIDRGYKKRVKAIKDLPGSVSVGIHAAEGSAAKDDDDRLTVLQVAIWNEFGTSRIPARSFIGAWFDENKDKASAWWTALNRQVAAGKLTKERALNLFGLKCVGEIQARIANGVPPPNAPSTVRRKGSSKPLIDTGQLRSSITYAAHMKGGG